MDNKEIKNKLIQCADEKYKNFHKSLCPNTIEILGVTVPKLRNIAKQILVDSNVEIYLTKALDDSYEEIVLQGLVLGLWKTNIENFIKYLKKFIPKIQSWAICDVSVAGFKIVKKNMKYMWDFIQKYLKSENEYELRFAIVMILDFYITEEYIEDVLEILKNVKSDKYYAKMAIAWAIQVCFVKFPKETKQMLKNNNIDNWIYNKAIQKILESYRVSNAEKQELKQMKRKI